MIKVIELGNYVSILLIQYGLKLKCVRETLHNKGINEITHVKILCYSKFICITPCNKTYISG